MRPRADTFFAALRANIFPTVLDLMNYPVELRKHSSAISRLQAKAADSGDRFFITSHVMLDDTFIRTKAPRD